MAFYQYIYRNYYYYNYNNHSHYIYICIYMNENIILQVATQRFKLQRRKTRNQCICNLLWTFCQHVHSHCISCIRLQAHMQTISSNKALDRLALNSTSLDSYLHLTMTGCLTEGTSHQFKSLGCLQKLLDFGSLKDRRTAEYRSSRHSILNNHRRNTATLSDRTCSTVCTGDEGPLCRSHRDVVQLGVDQHRTNHSNRDRNIADYTFTVVSLQNKTYKTLTTATREKNGVESQLFEGISFTISCCSFWKTIWRRMERARTGSLKRDSSLWIDSSFFSILPIISESVNWSIEGVDAKHRIGRVARITCSCCFEACLTKFFTHWNCIDYRWKRMCEIVVKRSLFLVILFLLDPT